MAAESQPASSVPTPEFLLWALEYSCPPRGFESGASPERTERQLRAARAISDSRREGRVWGGLALLPPLGFRIDEAARIYGGMQQLEFACRHCPANALDQNDPQSLAGCYGTVILPAETTSFHRTVDETAGTYSSTRPAWYGLWLDSPLTSSQAADHSAVLRTLAKQLSVSIPGLGKFLRALDRARQHNLAMFVETYPQGRVESGNWILALHCPRCKAAWTAGGTGRCQVCTYTGAPAPNRKRKARGQRPYLPLSRLLGGDEAAARFLFSYEKSQTPAQSTDPPENPLPLKPPNSPPAD